MIPWTLNLDYLYLIMNLDCEFYRGKCIFIMLRQDGIEGFMNMVEQKMIVACYVFLSQKQ